MSFGGGTQYTLEYLIKVTNQGGTSGLNQINTGLKQVNQNVNNVAISQEKLQMIQDKVATSQQKVIQAQQGVTKGMKGLAFGILGVTTAGAEFVGMMSMWRQTTTAVTEAQNEVNRALKESGKNSKDYKDAVNELTKANRWARMTFRNLMLSMFDMVPFFILTINGIVKLRTAYKTLREAQLEQKAMQEVLRKSNIALGESNLLMNTSYTKLNAAQRIAKAEQALMIRSNEALAVSNAQVGTSMLTAAGQAKNYSNAAGATVKVNRLLAASNLSVNGSLITSIPLLGKTEKSMGILGKTGSKIGGVFAGIGAAASGMVKKFGPILLIIGSIIVAVEAWKNNWGGVGDVMNEVGVKIGNIHPILKTTMELLAKVGLTIDRLVHGDFEGVKNVWIGGSKEMADATTEMSEKQQKALEEASQALKEYEDSTVSMLFDISAADRGEQKDWMKSLGLDKHARKEMSGFLDDVEHVKTGLEDFHQSIDTMKALNIMQKFGMDVPDDMWKNLAKGLSKQLKDIGKHIPGDDLFEELAKIMKKSSKKKGPVVVKEMMAFLDKHPDFMENLKAWRPDIAAAIDAMLKGAATDANKSIGGSQGFMNAILGTGQSETTNDWSHMKEQFGIKDTSKGAGMLQPIIDKLKESLKGIGATIKGLDWTAIGTAIGDEIETIVTVKNAQRVGQLVRIYIVDPAYAAAYNIGSMIGKGIQDGWNNYKDFNEKQGKPTDPITKGVNFISEIPAQFVAGLIGFKDADDMQTKIMDGMKKFFASVPILVTLREIINDPVGGLWLILTGGDFMSNESIDIDPGIVGPKVKKALGIPSNSITIDSVMEGLGINALIESLPTAEDIKNKIKQDPIVQGLLTAGDYIHKGFEGFWKWLTSGTQTVFGETGGDMPLFSGGGFDWSSPTITIPEVNITTEGVNADDLRKKFGSAFQDIYDTMVDLANQWSGQGINMIDTAQTVAKGLRKQFGSSLQDIYDTMVDVANQWSGQGANMIDTSKSVAKGFRKNFGSALQDVYDTMKDLAHQWSVFCNSMIANAKSAAKGINKALDSIEDEEVIITYKEVGAPKAKGGLMSFANGGVMSAAGGKLLTTYGPQLFQIGDNPGGRESIWAIPHNNPAPTVAKIDKMYKGSTSSNGCSIYNQTINLNIKASDLVNDTKITRKIRSTMGEQMDRFG